MTLLPGRGWTSRLRRGEHLAHNGRAFMTPHTFLQRIFLAALLAATPVLGAPGTWELAWADEFTGTELNRQHWTFDQGGGGWGNRELQFYTDRLDNCFLTNGWLIIEAKRERFENREYTSARLKTQGLHSWTYGRIEARIQVPSGQGVWPAFWMLGTNITSVGWPACGEIDILEHVLPIGANTVRGSLHGPGYSGGQALHGDTTVSGLTSQFHVYAVQWEPEVIRWFVDGRKYFEVKPADLAPRRWVFDRPHFLLLNLAIGGAWPGSPDRSTPWPARMVVDYVRVYRRAAEG